MFGFSNRFLDNKKQEAIDRLMNDLRDSSPLPPRTTQELEVRGLTTINYHQNMVDMDFILTCADCSYVWQSTINGFRSAKEMNLLVTWCPECYKPAVELYKLPLLGTIEKRYRRENDIK